MKSWGKEQGTHPSIHLKGQGGDLKANMLHYIDNDLFDLFLRLNKYARGKAQELYRKQQKPDNIPLALWRGLGRFFKLYVMRQGYREKFLGFTIALAAGLYPLLTALYLKEYYNRGS